MAGFFYALSLTCLACAVLLLRGYARVRHRMLFWSGLCFLGLTVSNVLLVLDRVVFIEADISTGRLATALLALLLLLYGLIWESE